MAKILITGGAGYVGSALVPSLIEDGHEVIVYDLFLYGNIFKEQAGLKLVRSDIRNQESLKQEMQGVDTVIHLACISNDPSFDLNPTLGRSINLDAFTPLVEISRDSGVKRFIYASSSSVYGIKKEENVHEKMSLEPLTDYSKFKAECESILQNYDSKDFCTVTVRPATVCGYAPRQRLDVIVNILVNHAYHNQKIKIFGGSQKRPNIHVKDMVRVYQSLIAAPADIIRKQVFNAGCANHSLEELANLVQDGFKEEKIDVERVSTDDHRSYHISSQHIQDHLGFKMQHSVEDAVLDLKKAFKTGLLPNALEDKRYYNIKTMLDVGLA